MSVPDAPSDLLSDSQRRLVALAVVLLALAVTVAVLVGTLAGLGWLLGYFSGVLWPLAVAGILALMLRPAVDWLETRLRFGRVPAVLMLYGVVVVVLAGGLVLIGPPLLDQAQALVGSLPEFWRRALAWARDHLPDRAKSFGDLMADPTVRDLGQSLSAGAQKLLGNAGPSLALAGAGLLSALSFAAHLLLVPVYLLYLLLLPRASGRPARGTGLLPPALRDDGLFLLREFVGIVVAFFRGQMLIGGCMGVLYALGFTLVGLKFGFVLGLALGLLNVVPYLGTLTSLVTVLPVALLDADGGWRLAGLVLAVLGVVQAVESWVLTPRIMGRQTGLHPMAITVAFLFWTTALGWLPGLVLAVPLTAFLLTLWRFAREKMLAARPASP